METLEPLWIRHCILTVTSEYKVPSRLKLLHEGVLFLLMRAKIHSSSALSTTSATRKSNYKKLS